MHLGMTVQASVRQQELRGSARRQLIRHLRQAAVTHRRVAFLTKLGCPPREQTGLVRAVRHVACEAILRSRRMFPKERPPLLGMAGKARLVHAVMQRQRLPYPAVRIVTVTTDELPLPHRVGRALQRVCEHAAVAGATYLALHLRCPHRVRVGMNAMAVGTREVSLLVGAAQPVGALVGFVARKAQPILQLGRRVAALAEIQHRLAAGTFRQHPAVVLPRRPMARLALQTARW